MSVVTGRVLHVKSQTEYLHELSSSLPVQRIVGLIRKGRYEDDVSGTSCLKCGDVVINCLGRFSLPERWCAERLELQGMKPLVSLY